MEHSFSHAAEFKPIKGIVKNFIKLFSGKPKLKPFARTKIEGYDHIILTREQIVKWLDVAGHRPIFLIGPWGCGKTTHILELIRWCEQNRSDISFVLRSFFGARSLEEGYLLLTTWPAKATLFVFLFIATAIGWGSEDLQKWGVIFYLLSIFLFLNRHKLIYFFASVFASFRRKKIEVFILDDFDRSSMDDNDKWAVLSNLYESRRRYIISIGYSYDKPEAKQAIYESVAKLNGVVVEIELCSHINYLVAKDLDPLIPFDSVSIEWMEKFTPRQIIELYEKVYTQLEVYKTKNTPLLIEILYVQSYFSALCRKCGLQLAPEKFSIKFSNDPKDPKATFSFTEKESISEVSQHRVASFFNSLSSDFVKEVCSIIMGKKHYSGHTADDVLKPLFCETLQHEFIEYVKEKLDGIQGS